MAKSAAGMRSLSPLCEAVKAGDFSVVKQLVVCSFGRYAAILVSVVPFLPLVCAANENVFLTAFFLGVDVCALSLALSASLSACRVCTYDACMNVRACVQEAGVELNTTDGRGRTPLILSLIHI